AGPWRLRGNTLSERSENPCESPGKCVKLVASAGSGWDHLANAKHDRSGYYVARVVVTTSGPRSHRLGGWNPSRRALPQSSVERKVRVPANVGSATRNPYQLRSSSAQRGYVACLVVLNSLRTAATNHLVRPSSR